MTTDRVTVTTLVPGSPGEAFHAFTDNIDGWWRRGRRHRAEPASSIVRFEGDRLVEITSTGAIELGLVRAWEPGERLVLEWRGATPRSGENTQVEIRFEGEGASTRVTLEHRGWPELRPGDAASGVIGLWWGDLLAAYKYGVSHPVIG